MIKVSQNRIIYDFILMILANAFNYIYIYMYIYIYVHIYIYYINPLYIKLNEKNQFSNLNRNIVTSWRSLF